MGNILFISIFSSTPPPPPPPQISNGPPLINGHLLYPTKSFGRTISRREDLHVPRSGCQHGSMASSLSPWIGKSPNVDLVPWHYQMSTTTTKGREDSRWFRCVSCFSLIYSFKYILNFAHRLCRRPLGTVGKIALSQLISLVGWILSLVVFLPVPEKGTTCILLGCGHWLAPTFYVWSAHLSVNNSAVALSPKGLQSKGVHCTPELMSPWKSR